MKFLLLRPAFQEENNLSQNKQSLNLPPLGLLYIGASLEKDGHKVEILDYFAENISKNKLKKSLNSCDAVGITTYTDYYKPTADMLTKMKMPMDAPDISTSISITFKDGIPVQVRNKEDGKIYLKPLDIINFLNEAGGENGIGYMDMVENRFIGIKSRGVYETPGVTILFHAHRDIEGIAMDREVMKLRNMLTPKFSEIVYNGFWFSPEMDFLMASINKSQELIDGTVNLSLYKGNVIIEGRNSPSSLYDEKLSSMDIEGGFDQTDSNGFIKINAIRLMAHRAIIESSK